MTNETIVLDTPEQIQMWVLLSRRAQLKLWLKGEGTENPGFYQTKGLIKWCRVHIPGCESARRARDCIVPVENAIVFAGGPQDFSIVNVHVMEVSGDYFLDRGVFPDMSAVEAEPALVELYNLGLLELVYTMDAPREPNGKAYLPV
jgi:hypothetical protein